VASFTLVREVAAPPDVVFDVLTDHRRYAELTPLRCSELEREGEPAPNGVGAIRVLGAVGPPLREEVIAYEPSSRYSYTLLSGLPVRNHVGTVSLEPAGAGTKVTYAVRTNPTVPLVGGVVVAIIKQSIKLLLGGACTEAERRAASGGRAGPDG
jgi:uncharacterized protein YndB with AHSA1/START domain